MNRNSKTKNDWFLVVAVFGLSGAAASCVSTQPHIHQNVQNAVQLQRSEAHDFRYVNVTNDDGELVVYGKIVHSHVTCSTEGHVDVAIVNADTSSAYSTSIPVVRRSSRQRGWYGAAFRARLPIRLTEGQTVRLAFHDDGCVTTQTYNCQDNRALSLASGEGPSVKNGAE